MILHAVINHSAHVFLYMVGGRPYDIELKIKQFVGLREITTNKMKNVIHGYYRQLSQMRTINH